MQCSKCLQCSVFIVLILVNVIHLVNGAHHQVYRHEQKPDKLKYEIIYETNCEIISHPNAIINDCGFCVEGDTGLSRDYGKDCLGICFGNATFDCMGVCNGNAYIDECSETCIHPGSEIDKYSILSASRDCRGLCNHPSSDPTISSTTSALVPVSSQTYSIDQCGLCSLSQSAAFSDPNMSPMPLSHSLDCRGNCQLPGFTKHTTVCGKCIRQNELLSVIDNCGNCLDEGNPCSCDRDPVRCGCIDPNNCYLIKSLSPLAIPNGIDVNISIVGYFYPYVNQLFCVVRSQSFEIIESFPVQFFHKNKTFIQCNLRLEQFGEYVLGLGFRKNVLITPPKDLLHLYAYEPNTVNITSIYPERSFANESDKRLEILFNDRSNQIPPVPFRCKIIYENGKEELSDFGVKEKSCILKESSDRLQSQIIQIYPTFDGLNLISSGFSHLIEAPAPKIFSLSSFISEDSLSIIVNFDKAVDIEYIESHIREYVDIEDEEDLALIMCDYLLLDHTIEQLSLFELKSCKWATRIQLIISMLKPLSTDTIEIEIKQQVLTEYKQKYPLYNEAISANISKLSSSINWWSYEPMIAITGPQEVSFCGNFALIGHFSSPRGTTEVDFQWEVLGEVTADLYDYVKQNGKSTNLLLNAEMFNVNSVYTFNLKAFIHARKQSIEATHSLIRLDFETPNLSIYSTGLLESLPHYENDPVILFADFTIPDCIYPPQVIRLGWKTSDPRILFPIKHVSKRISSIFTVDPYSIPPNHTTSITLTGYIGFYQNQTSKSSIQMKPLPALLKGNPANGINRITIGSQSGILTIVSKNNLRGKRFVYQWSCHDTKSGQPCYFNFASTHANHQRDTILITRKMQSKENLIVNSTSFQSNNQYLIGLQVFDANNSKISSETEYILLNVVDGEKPQVFVGPIFINGDHMVPYNNRFSTFIIPSGSDIHIKGRAYLNTGVKHIKWISNMFRYPLSWSTERISQEEIVTELLLNKDTLTAFGTYNIKLEACSLKNECSWSEISLLSAQSTTMCEVIVEPYVELEMTLATVDKCNIPPSASPITYQLYLEDQHYPNMVPLTMPQFSPVIIFAGTPIPVFTENQLIRLSVKVCDRFATCTMHRSPPIHVEHTQNLANSIEKLLQQAKRSYQSGEIMLALSYLNAIFLKPDITHVNDQLFESAINSTIEYSTAALQIPNLVLANGHYELLLGMFSQALHKTDKIETKRKLLSSIIRYFDKANAYKMAPSIQNIRNVYSNVMNSFIINKLNESMDEEMEFFKDIRNTFRRIKKAIASQLPLGSRVVLLAERVDTELENNSILFNKIHTTYTEIVHLENVEDVHIKAQMSGNQTITAKVEFGKEIREMFKESWNCNQKLKCSSVVQAVTVFPKENPFPSNKKSHKLSPIIDITIHAPKTGQEQQIRGLFKASTFELTVTGNETYGGSNYRTKCHYFDEKTQLWLMDDIHPLGIAYNQTGCWSGHLSSFVVLRTVTSISANYIIGVLVACTMGVLVFGMMVVFYVQRKQQESADHKTKDADNEQILNRNNNIIDSNTNSDNDHLPDGKGQRISHRKLKNAKTLEIQSKTILVKD